MSQATLADACTPMSSNIAQKDLVGKEGQYPIYGASGLIGFVNFYKQECQYIAVVKDGAGVGRVFCLPPYSSVIGTLQYLIPKEGIDVKYLSYALQFMHLEKYYTGATIPHIYYKDYKKEPIPIPALEVQQQISETLGYVDQAIEILNDQIAGLSNIVKSRFVEMFGDLYNNSMNWSLKKFTECATIESNMIHDFTGYENVPHIGIDSIEKNTGALIGYRTVQEDGIISGKYLFTPKHIIYSKIRPNLNKVALPNFEGVCSADSYAILPNEDICNRIFFAHVMRSSIFLDYILPFSNRTNLPKVNRKQVEGFMMPTPPLALQNEFAAFVEQTDKSEYCKLLQLQICLKTSLLTGFFELSQICY